MNRDLSIEETEQLLRDYRRKCRIVRGELVCDLPQNFSAATPQTGDDMCTCAKCRQKNPQQRTEDLEVEQLVRKYSTASARQTFAATGFSGQAFANAFDRSIALAARDQAESRRAAESYGGNSSTPQLNNRPSGSGPAASTLGDKHFDGDTGDVVGDELSDEQLVEMILQDDSDRSAPANEQERLSRMLGEQTGREDKQVRDLVAKYSTPSGRKASQQFSKALDTLDGCF